MNKKTPENRENNPIDDYSNPGNKYNKKNRIPKNMEKKGFNNAAKKDLNKSKKKEDEQLDKTLEDTFPASDPSAHY